MFEFLLATGKYGVFGVCLVFVVVFLLATPGKEISFWGIRFHKRYGRTNRFRVRPFWRRLPPELPLEWKGVLVAFRASDEYHLSKDRIYMFAKNLKMSKLETKKAVDELEKFGVVNVTMNSVSLTSKGVSIVSKERQKKEE